MTWASWPLGMEETVSVEYNLNWLSVQHTGLGHESETSYIQEAKEASLREYPTANEQLLFEWCMRIPSKIWCVQSTHTPNHLLLRLKVWNTSAGRHFPENCGIVRPHTNQYISKTNKQTKE